MEKVLKYALLMVVLLGIDGVGFAGGPIRCGTVNAFNLRALSDAQVRQRRDQLEIDIQQWIAANSVNKTLDINATITVPVVVHVVWNTTQQNISDAQVNSQIDRLNKDYRKLNTDMLPSNHPFYGLAADAGIEFCLAKFDVGGNPTTGITRKQTTVASFTSDDKVKSEATGGTAAWDATKYLNIWVCNLTGDLLGYAQYPSEFSASPGTDGVVIKYSNFGTMGAAAAPYNMGRTTTHEIGHWLNLLHIWGDDENGDGVCDAGECSGTDNVSDTPNECEPNYDCPPSQFAIKTDSCSPSYPGIMYENYMDYSDDACMVMFTVKQVTRMKAVFSLSRPSIITANKCSSATGIINQSNSNIRIYPNPVENYLVIEGLPKTGKIYNIDIFNAIGQKVYSVTMRAVEEMIELQGLKTGTYVMNIYNEEFSAVKKISVVR